MLSARVRLGCVPFPGGIRDPRYGVDGYDVRYGAKRIVVTFTGRRSPSDALCLTTEEERIELREELGDRDFYDGSFDPPREPGVGP